MSSATSKSCRSTKRELLGNEMTKVSIVIPTLNRPEMTLRAFNSVIGQTHTDLEVVIVDNGSSPENLAKMRKLGLVWISELVKGAGAARMAGLANTSGDYLVFLDSDDELLPGALTSLLEALTVEAHLAYGGIGNVNQTDLQILHEDESKPAPLVSCTMVRRTAITQFGGFTVDNFSWPRWYLLAKEQGLIECSTFEPVALRYIHGENISLSENPYSEFFGLIREKIARRDAMG